MDNAMMTDATRKLRDRREETQEIVNIRNKVYVAVAYDTSYMSMIVGTDGIIIVDSGERPQAAAAIMERFRAISDKPLKALLFTHSHWDHVNGAPGVIGSERARGNRAFIDVWGRENFGSEARLGQLLPDVFRRRGAWQFGAGLSPDKRTKPLGPKVLPDPGEGRPVSEKPIRVNRRFAGDMMSLELAGVRLEFYAAPGETSDQMFIWMPDERIAFAGDTIYASFPNLYAVRGAGYRDVDAWANSVALIRDKQPEVLIMGHTRPIQDPAVCAEWLGSYHDAIRCVFDETIAGMNRGLTADEVAESVRLPAHLAEKPWLTEFYGNVAWAVRSIFNGHLGWFDGDARRLAPLPLADEAARMMDMAGGVDAALERARAALARPAPRSGPDKDAAWAAQLASYVLRLHPAHAGARAVSAEALERLGEATLSTSGRNYLLCAAQAMRD